MGGAAALQQAVHSGARNVWVRNVLIAFFLEGFP
jgi:hypothetical protein